MDYNVAVDEDLEVQEKLTIPSGARGAVMLSVSSVFVVFVFFVFFCDYFCFNIFFFLLFSFSFLFFLFFFHFSFSLLFFSFSFFILLLLLSLSFFSFFFYFFTSPPSPFFVLLRLLFSCFSNFSFSFFSLFFISSFSFSSFFFFFSFPLPSFSHTLTNTGIPHAYVIGRDGIIVYSGHPMDPKFLQAIEKALSKQVEKKPLPLITASEEELKAMSVKDLKV
jgi:hypothetical protein